MIRRIGPAMLAAVIFYALGMAGCSHSGSSAAQVSRGKELYDVNCAPCHEASVITLPTQPPKLDGLFRKQNLPSGAPATDAQVRDTIVQGRGVMPPFGPALQPDEIDALIAYLHTR